MGTGSFHPDRLPDQPFGACGPRSQLTPRTREALSKVAFTSPPVPEKFNDSNNNYHVPPRLDEYNHIYGTGEDLAVVTWARAIQANGYAAMKFVQPKAVDPETGHLIDSVDASNTDFLAPFTKYSIGYREDHVDDASTFHQIGVPPGKSVDILPAVQMMDKDNLYPVGKRILVQDPSTIVEMGGLARTKEAEDGRGTYEAIRTFLHDDLGKGKIWTFCIVERTFGGMLKDWGSKSMTKMGDPFDLNSDLVNVRLTPAALNVDTFFDDIYRSAVYEPDQELRTKQFESFLFFTDGIPDELLSGNEMTRNKLMHMRNYLRNKMPDAIANYGHRPPQSKPAADRVEA